MHINCGSSRHQQHRLSEPARSIHAYDFFNLLTGPDLLDLVDVQLPPRRERLYSPTDTLSLYMAQVLSPDTSRANRWSTGMRWSG